MSLNSECKFRNTVTNSIKLTFTSSPGASWHTDYRDTAYIYIGGLPFELSEGDIVTIFSQFGEPTYINLVRDKETGKSKGFAFLKYEDQRSTDLAVDNLGGAVIMDRTLKVDHTRYKKKDDEPDPGHHLDESSNQPEDDGEGRRKRRRTSESESEEERRPMLKEEVELAKLIQEHDEDDPMKAYLIQEKKDEVALALAKVKGGKDSEKTRKHRHHHRSRHSKEDDAGEEGSRRSRHRKEGHSRRRSRSREGKDDERSHRRRDEPKTTEEYRSRKRSPGRDNNERDRDERRRRDRSREDRHRSRREPRD